MIFLTTILMIVLNSVVFCYFLLLDNFIVKNCFSINTFKLIVFRQLIFVHAFFVENFFHNYIQFNLFVVTSHNFKTSKMYFILKQSCLMQLERHQFLRAKMDFSVITYKKQKSFIFSLEIDIEL